MTCLLRIKFLVWIALFPLLLSFLSEVKASSKLNAELKPIEESAVHSSTSIRERNEVQKAALAPRLFTVDVVNIPMKEFLYALARDAGVQIDIHPDIQDKVSLVVKDQTLEQILKRIVQLGSIRLTQQLDRIIVEPDYPYHRRYGFDYLNIGRSITLKTQISSSLANNKANSSGASAQENNHSSLLLETQAEHKFWPKLKAALCQTLMNMRTSSYQPRCRLGSDNSTEYDDVVLYPEIGIIAVYATQRQHEEIAELLKDFKARVSRQVLIEATIVEVELNEGFEAGVDWTFLLGGGVKMGTSFLSNTLATSPFIFFSKEGATRLQTLIKALETFGQTKVLSSPRVMALNNQTAVLKVVNEEVYFTLEIKEDFNRQGEMKHRKFESQLHTVPVGLVMNVTPQIGETGVVSLYVKPSITSIGGYQDDPAVSLYAAEQGLAIKSQVPILQIREFDSMLSIPDQHIAILGGLIRDDQRTSRESVPILGKLPLLGRLFQYQHQRKKKSELIIFLRPKVIQPLNTDINASAHLPVEGFLQKSGAKNAY